VHGALARGGEQLTEEDDMEWHIEYSVNGVVEARHVGPFDSSYSAILYINSSPSLSGWYPVECDCKNPYPPTIDCDDEDCDDEETV